MPPLEQLHDIEGLDSISAWPLSSGWWILILGFAVGIFFLKKRLDYLRSWKKDTFKKLDHLEKNLSSSTSFETIAFLSEYLRRIAIKRFPRKECAGLVGSDWLKWLEAHDPKQFDWTEKGKLLIEIPYAPLHKDLSLEEIKVLIKAARCWVN